MQNDPAVPNSSKPPFDWETLARYLAGECSLDESEHIARWLAEHPADSQLLAAMDNAMANLALREAPDVDVEGALQRALARRDEESDAAAFASPKIIPFHRRTASPWRLVTALAAAAILIFAARTVLQRKVDATGSPAAATSARSYATAVGNRDSITLSDGSRVILGPASRLTVAAGYGQRIREVELHGEGYFDVVHDTTRPFIVHVGDATLRDIGTSFAVRADADSHVQVVVTSGSVLLQAASGAKNEATLVAGDVALLDGGGQISTQHKAPTRMYLGWMQDSLVFRDASLAQVSDELRRWYGISLRVSDSGLAKKHLTNTFYRDPIDRVLRVIGLSFGADVERRGDTAFVTPSRRVREGEAGPRTQ